MAASTGASGGPSIGEWQESEQAALLGLRDEAAALVMQRASWALNASAPNSIGEAGARDHQLTFPGFFGSLQEDGNYYPDPEHPGQMRTALQFMMLQNGPANASHRRSHSILLFAALPKDVDVEIKLPAFHRTTIVAECKDNIVVRLEVDPPERKRDVVLLGCPPGGPRLKDDTIASRLKLDDPSASTPFVIDVEKEYGTIAFETLVEALAAGVNALGKHDYVTVRIAAGNHVINMTGDLFTVEAVQAAGELAVEGAGMDATVLLLSQGMHDMIKGSSWRNIAFRDLSFSHTSGQTSKGRVVAVGNSSITLEVHAGFPTPQHILENRYPRLRPDQGLYMLQYSTAPPGSALIPAKRTTFANTVNVSVHGALPSYNAHLPYRCSLSETPAVNRSVSGYVCDAVRHVGGSRWQFSVRPDETWASLRPFYEQAIGDANVVVGIKAKRGGQAYALADGDGLKFERVRWQGYSRGIISNSNGILLNETDVSPMPPPVRGHGYATATNGGGPQIKESSNVVVVGHTSQSSGDDSLAFFGITSGTVTGCVINDGWGAGMLLSNLSAAFSVHSNTVRRTPIYYPDKIAPPGPGPAPPAPGSSCAAALAECVGQRKCKECAKAKKAPVGNCTQSEVQAWMAKYCGTHRPAAATSRKTDDGTMSSQAQNGPKGQSAGTTRPEVVAFYGQDSAPVCTPSYWLDFPPDTVTTIIMQGWIDPFMW
eukprot:SAG22_NODE_94_length_20824_cov_230.693718_13_plen_712_part_00